jgi:hypothetical protein
MVKYNLKKYKNIFTKPIDYYDGDFIVPKENTDLIDIPFRVYYMLNMLTSTVAYIDKNEIKITTIRLIFHERASDSVIKNTDIQLLYEFIEDKVIHKNIQIGTFVRPRLHYKLNFNYSPCIVIERQHDHIKIAGYCNNKIVELTVKWYELAFE